MKARVAILILLLVTMAFSGCGKPGTASSQGTNIVKKAEPQEGDDSNAKNFEVHLDERTEETKYAYWKDDISFVDTVTGIFGILAGVCLLISALHRAVGRKPFFLFNGVVCLYLALRLFNCCQRWSNEPQLNTVVFPFLASIALMLSAYHRVCFDVDLANRRWAAFWTLMSVYLCVVAMISFEQPLFYGLAALWQMANLCSMRPLKRKPQPVIRETEAPQSAGETQPPEAEE